jgi:quinol monooxygenase YgiN
MRCLLARFSLGMTAPVRRPMGDHGEEGSSQMDTESQAAERTGQAQSCCPIVELRQYTLHPQRRETLIELFEREFVESQEAVGIRVIGQFRDLDDPDRFVWLRGFQTMPARAEALAAFYGGPVWKTWRDAANATMTDSSNVLLLHPARPGSGFSLEGSDHRPPLSAIASPQPDFDQNSGGLVVATIYSLNAPVGEEFLTFFEQALQPVVAESGCSTLAYLVTESSVNTFPALPVREGEFVFVWFLGFPHLAAYERHAAALAQSARWRRDIIGELTNHLTVAPDVRKLLPTVRSQLHG